MNRVVSLWVVAATVVVGVVLGGTHRVRAADEPVSSAAPAGSVSSAPLACVTDKAKQDLEACPNGPKLAGSSPHGKAPEMSFHSKVEELKKGDKKNEIGTA